MSEVARPGPLISPGATLVPDLALARHQHHGQTRAMLGAGQAAHHTYLCLSSTNTDTETHGHTGYQDVTLQTHSDTRIMSHSDHWSQHHHCPRRQPLCIARPRPCPEASHAACHTVSSLLSPCLTPTGIPDLGHCAGRRARHQACVTTYERTHSLCIQEI